MTYIVRDWDTCARLLGRAFSRYNGLTNSARLEYITQLITADIGKENGNLFDGKPFLYAHEVIKKFENYKNPEKPEDYGEISRSSEVLLQHAVSFNFLYRAVSGGKSMYSKLAKKVESLSHIALTPLGRALRSSRCLGSNAGNFKLFLWEYALLERDFDMYGLIIKMAEENDGKMVDVTEFFDKFDDIRRKQIEWMKKEISRAASREKIQHHISWIGDEVWTGKYHGRQQKKCKRQFELDKLFCLNQTSKGHHHGQRIRWAQRFGHISNHKLIEHGILFAKKLPSTDHSPFFWLGPPTECAESRWLSATKISTFPRAPAWNLLRPSDTTPTTPSDEFVTKVAKYMVSSFDLIRLTNFKQSSLDVIVPYVYFLEDRFGKRVDVKVLFQRVLDRNREKFVCTLRADLAKSHYHIRET